MVVPHCKSLPIKKPFLRTVQVNCTKIVNDLMNYSNSIISRNVKLVRGMKTLRLVLSMNRTAREFIRTSAKQNTKRYLDI